MSATEFKVGDHLYSATRLDAFAQLHIGRRLAPGMAFITAQGGKFNAILEVLSSMAQADVDFIVTTAIKAVKRRSGDSWAPVYSEAGHRMAFDDINGIEMLEIVGRALEGDLAPFFSGLVKLAFDTDPLTSALSPTQKTSS